MEIKDKLDLLTKPYWDYHDISRYVNCGTTKAIEIKNQALREFGGSIRYLSQFVTVDSVMKCIGTTREREIEIIEKVQVQERN